MIFFMKHASCKAATAFASEYNEKQQNRHLFCMVEIDSSWDIN